jgi:putative isomerase
MIRRQELIKSRTGLLRSSIRGLNGEFGNYIGSLCYSGSEDFSSSFFWDSLFTSVAYSRFNPEAAKGAIAIAYHRQLEYDGSSPERKWNFSPARRMQIACPQSPLGGWALRSYYDNTSNIKGVAELYDKVAASHLFWRDFSDSDRDGLAEYNWSGQMGDNSPLWDPVTLGYDETSGCSWLPPIASVALNSFIYRDAEELARLATILGKDKDAVMWQERKAYVAKRLKEVCYLPDEGRYSDYNHRTQTHNRVKTFFSFLPLWAGVPVPEDVTRNILDDLLSNDSFFGAVPFPSVEYIDPSYFAGTYWRGKAWPHFTYFLCEVLVRHGYTAEEKEAARRTLSFYSGVGNRLENMTTDPAVTEPNGFKDYNWGNAATILLEEEAYL